MNASAHASRLSACDVQTSVVFPFSLSRIRCTLALVPVPAAAKRLWPSLETARFQSVANPGYIFRGVEVPRFISMIFALSYSPTYSCPCGAIASAWMLTSPSKSSGLSPPSSFASSRKIVCREGGGAENGRYANRETALMFPIVSQNQPAELADLVLAKDR